jgi:hypothetical protein
MLHLRIDQNTAPGIWYGISGSLFRLKNSSRIIEVLFY